MREKKHWERQIKKLGGPDYAVSVIFLGMIKGGCGGESLRE